MGIGEIWDLIILSPVINVLIVLSDYLFGNFGLAIIALTIAVNVVMLPLTKKQLRSFKAMQDIKPKLTELQKKYAKDKQKLAREQMRMYKESGMNPAGCMVPMLVQMPIWIALFQSIIRLLAVTPEGFLSLSQYLYSSWPVVFSMVPLWDRFLWLNLATGDTFMALLVGGTMWVQQKMVMSPTADPKQEAQSRMMLWMMPMMFAFLTLSFPSGLALFWVTSNAIRIALQYSATGWGGLVPSAARKQVTRDRRYQRRIALEEAPLKEADIGADIVVEPSSTQEEELGDGKSGDKRQDSRGGYTTSLKAIRRRSGGSRGHRHKRR